MDAGAFLQVCISSRVHYIVIRTFISRRFSPFPHVKKYYVNLEALIELFAMPGGDLIIKEIWKHRRAVRERLPALRSTLRHPALLTLAPGSAETRWGHLPLLALARSIPIPQTSALLILCSGSVAPSLPHAGFVWRTAIFDTELARWIRSRERKLLPTPDESEECPPGRKALPPHLSGNGTREGKLSRILNLLLNFRV